MARKYFGFLNIVIDVFYSIILYNVFMAFPGFGPEAFMMLLSTMVVINYWWGTRIGKVPKYHLIDFYFIAIVMFLFSQWPGQYLNITNFIYIMAAIWAVNAVYTQVDIRLHRTKVDEPYLRTYFRLDACLAIFYLLCSFFITTVDWTSIALLWIPYLAVYAYTLSKGMLPLKFIGTE